MAKFKDRTGEVGYNNNGSKMTIIKYVSTRDIVVEFEDGYKKKARYETFKNGQVKNPYDKTVYGVGFLGEGEYNNSTHKSIYTRWKSMLERCYDVKYQEKHPTYKGCTVAEEWHNFQNFAKWYDENYYEVDGEQMHLDKDILIKGNKVYSPETCVFVSRSINSLFPKNDKNRGKYPIGVYLDGDKYKSHCSDMFGEQKTLGLYDTPEEAFQVYKEYKELLLRDTANEYLGKIPMKLYYAMIAYDVEIND